MGERPNCARIPIVAEREAACAEPYTWDDSSPYCDTCGLWRESVWRAWHETVRRRPRWRLRKDQTTNS